MPFILGAFVVLLLPAARNFVGASRMLVGPSVSAGHGPQTVRGCDAALMKKLAGVHEKGYVYIQAFRLQREIHCYQRARAYTDATAGPNSPEEFGARMRAFARNMINSKNAAEFARREDIARLWPYFDDETFKDHRREIRLVAGQWSHEIDYVSHSRWKEYQDVMWIKFLNAFKGGEKKKIVVAINVDDGGGGNTELCNTCDGCFTMFCKSTLWSLVHMWDHFFRVPRGYGFMQGVDLYFYGKDAQAVPASRADARTVVAHLQDASYSGDQIAILTNKLPSVQGTVQVGLIVVGKRHSASERPDHAEEYSVPCSLDAERCYIFGHEAEEGLSPRTCVMSSRSFEHGAHFIVQHKAADDISMGACWQWYQFLGLRTPYNQDHALLPVAPEGDDMPPASRGRKRLLEDTSAHAAPKIPASQGRKRPRKVEEEENAAIDVDAD